MDVRFQRQVDFGFADVQKADGVAGGHLAGLGGGHDIVGEFADPRGQFGFGTEGGKGFYRSHIMRQRTYTRVPERHAE